MSTPKLRDYQAAAEYTGFTVRFLRTAVHERRIAVVKTSGPTGPTKFLESDLDAFIEACRQPAEVGPAAKRMR